MIIQKSEKPNNWGLCGEEAYLMSALTRATDLVVLITIGFTATVKNLRELIYKKGRG